MERRAHSIEDNIDKLYEASLRGSASSLNTLMQNDPLIFHKISLSSFTQTPLHISSLLGHLEFTKLLLTQKPELAQEVDSLKHSPLHLACAEGHREIVIELLTVNTDVCLAEDQDGRIPLHVAAMRGRVEVVKLLVRAKPESVSVLLNGDTVLHLCVKFNHLEALKGLVKCVDNEEFMNLKNHRGYTILDLSAILNQLQTTNYLLSIPQIKVDVNSLIENGFTFHASSRSDGQIIQHNLQTVSAGSTYPTSIQATPRAQSQTTPQPNAAATTLHAHSYEAQAVIVQPSFANLKERLKFNSDRLEKTRGNLMVVATLIATMSFQVAVNPPGGFWQEDTDSNHGCPIQNSTCKAGTAIQAYKYTGNIITNSYHLFMACSTISFSTSLSIILLLISGIPLRNKISVGILILGMFISVLFTAATYMLAVGFIQPPNDPGFLHHTVVEYEGFWVLLLLVIVGIHVLRFCWWILKKIFGFFSWIVKKLFNTGAVGNQPRRGLV